MTGTPLFLAPEQLRREHYDEKVDIWAFACTLESLSTRKMPYYYWDPEQRESEEDMNKVQQRAIQQVSKGYLAPSVPAGPDGALVFQELVKLCANSDAKVRPSFKVVCEYLRHDNKPRKLAEDRDQYEERKESEQRKESDRRQVYQAVARP